MQNDPRQPLNPVSIIGGACKCGEPVGHAGPCYIVPFEEFDREAFDPNENRYKWPEDRR